MIQKNIKVLTRRKENPHLYTSNTCTLSTDVFSSLLIITPQCYITASESHLRGGT